MAYLRKSDLVLIKHGGTVQSLVVDIQFRRFRKSFKDKKTGEKKYKWKSVPYAVCKVFNSTIEDIKIGAEFVIAGYKLRNIDKDGTTALILDSKYIAEYETGYGNEWVKRLLEESKASRENKKAS